MNIKDRIIKARIGLLTTQVFWGTLALRLQIVEAKNIPTLAVDGKRIFYNPDFVARLSDADLRTVVAHEVSHCVFEHIGRRGDRNKVKWNQAGDYAINQVLKNAGFDYEGPGGWLLDPQFNGMTADAIYNRLPDPPKGSNGGALCEIMDGDLSKNPDLVDDWKIATAQAAMAAQQAGKLPADLARFVNELLNPKTDWRTQLRRFVTEIAQDDYHWMRPQRKMLAHGIYLPSLWSEQMGEIVIVVDTSGSIDSHTLGVFTAEIQSIRDAVRPKMTRVIYCDARVNHVNEFTAEDILETKMHGGGGTDFRPPFELIEEEGWKPQCLCYLTDGYGPFPDAPAAYPTIWCMTTNVQPPWGERTEIDVALEAA